MATPHQYIDGTSHIILACILRGRAMPKRDGLVKYDPDYHDEHATKFCLLGATNADLGRVFEVAESTVEGWMQRHPSFKKAVLKGREFADADVAHSLYRRAKGWKHRASKIMQHNGRPVIVDYTEKYPADTGAAVHWLTNRRGDKWKNKQSNEHSGPDGTPLQIATVRRVIIDPKK